MRRYSTIDVGLNLIPICLLLAFLGVLPAAGADRTEVELSQINGVYTDLAPELAPIQRGPVTIHVSTPSHRLAVHANRLQLTAQDGGLVEVDFEVDLEGEGELVARIEAGVSSTLEDEVTVPRQTVRVQGMIRIHPAPDGFTIVLEEMPETVEIKIDSRVLGQMVEVCGTLSAFLPIDCDDIARQAANARIPMPSPGEEVLLPASYLTTAERAVFDRFATPR